MRDDGSPKYINSANSDRFCKSRYLYGMEVAAAAARRMHRLFLVEGYRDVLAMRAAGFPETAGLCGVALGEGHLPLIGGCTHRVVLLLDGDDAGRKGDAAAQVLLEGHGFATSVVALPEGADPDSLVREVGLRAFHERTEEVLTSLCPDLENRLVERIGRCVYALGHEPSADRRMRWMRLLQEWTRQLSLVAIACFRPGTMKTSGLGRNGRW